MAGTGAGAASRVRAGAIFLSALLLAGVLLLDLRTGPEVSLAILYLAPIVLAAWGAGRDAGIGVALAAGLAWFLWDPAENARLEPVPLWNFAARLGIFLFVAISVGTLHRLFIRERQAAEALQRFNHELNQKVAERTEELRRSLREMELFTYTMAHDLRAPLRAIHGYADVLLEEHAREQSADAQALTRRMAQASRRMDRLARDLLAYGNLIHQPVESGPTPLEQPCREAVNDLETRIEAAAADVTIEEPLPCVVGHPGLLRTVFRELVENAVTFAVSGRPPRVRIRAERRGDRVIVWVEDNGAGIAPEHRERIFLPGQQLFPAMNPDGTGMGLTLARKAVDRLEGSLELVDRATEGSSFRIELRGC